MNGAESLVSTLLANGVRVCFMNPGTSEIEFVCALDREREMRGVLCLFEGVCSGAADGYARMTGRPAATLLHLGPGLANGLANFHNARKAHSPVVNIVGDHSTQHRPYNAPLTADTAGFARTVSEWVRVVERAGTVGEAASEAVLEALRPPGGVASLIVPADFSWTEGDSPGPRVSPLRPRVPDPARIQEAARILRSESGAAVCLAGRSLYGPALETAGRIAAATGCRVFAHRFAPRLAYGRGRFLPQRLAYFPEAAQTMMAGVRRLILVETEPPVSFFGYPGRRSLLAPEDCIYHTLACAGEDGGAALEALAGELGARSGPRAGGERVPPPTGGALTLAAIGQTLAALLPEGAILSDEMVTSGEPVWSHLPAAPPHDVLPVTGGSIGQCLPVALGAALACPGRKVVALEADGSGLYTLQALWTMAREALDVVTVIFANRRYKILEVEAGRLHSAPPGPRAQRMMDLRDPELDWTRLAAGCGVPAVRASTVDEFTAAFRAAMEETGPRLIEARFE